MFDFFFQVCGDKANGFNFGAITCESCKAFFRRNALKTKEVVCAFENDCKIDPFTRKFCTSCRLRKCFSIDMKKEWILGNIFYDFMLYVIHSTSIVRYTIMLNSCHVQV